MSMSKYPIETICKPTDRKSIIPYDPRFTPILDNIKKQVDVVWTASQVPKHDDKKYFKKIPSSIQKAIKFTLGFFALVDYIVIENAVKRLNEITNKEIIKGYRFQAYIEEEHAEMYGLLIDEYIDDEQEKEDLFNAITLVKSVKAKGDWATKHMNSQKSLSHILVGFACVEGGHFQSSFAFIDWLKTQNYQLLRLYKANDYISRDEGFHTDFAGLVHQYMDYPISLKECSEIVTEAYDVECMFIDELVSKEGFPGFSREMAYQHSKHTFALVANRLNPPNPTIDYNLIFTNTSSPFPFMVKRSLYKKGNFFETEDLNYFSNNQDEKGGNKKISTTGDF
jgi:ribonucleoside-diphosphate reductase subunit M2